MNELNSKGPINIKSDLSGGKPKDENSEYSFFDWIKYTFSFLLGEKETTGDTDISEKHEAEQASILGSGGMLHVPEIPIEEIANAQAIDKIASETSLTVEDIEALEEAEAGEELGGHTGDYTNILYGLGYIVNSVPRDLGLGLFEFTLNPVYFPVIPPVTSETPPPPDNPVSITDLTPQLEGGDAVVDEDDLLASRGPNESEGSDPNKESTTVSGDFKISAPDGVAFLVVGGQTLILNDVFTPQILITPLGNILNFISYDPGTGTVSYLYTLVDNENHPPGDGENSIFEDFPVILSDLDGDGATDTLSIRIIDDIASIQTTEETQTLTVDETFLSQNATGSFASLFSAIPGADGEKSLVYALGLGVPPGSESGLVDTLSNHPVLLFLEGDSIVGRIDGSQGDIVFTISIDTNTGEVTLDQDRAVVHADPNNPDDVASLSDASLITLTATITDNDDDIAFATKNIGDAFQFKDDGPSIQVALVDTPPDQLIVDETNLALNATKDFSDNFSIINSNFGADGAGTLIGTFALAVSSDGADSGLFDVATGEHVFLFLNNNGEVEGRTQNTNLLVFTVSVDNTGMVTLDQIRALTHPDQNDPDDSVTLSAANLVQLTFTGTIVDKDGDSAISAATLNIGTALIFHDDGPFIQVGQVGEPDQLIVDETNLALNATGDFSDNFQITNSNFGADGAGTLTGTFALAIFSNNVDSGLIDVATGQHVLLTLTGSGVVEGRTAMSNDLVFTVSVDNAGMVTLDQIRALVHPDPNNPDDSVTLSDANLIQLTFTGTIVDRDGDTATSSTTLNIGQSLIFHDDGPSIQVDLVNTPPDQLIVDETNLALNATQDFSDNFIITNSSFGADNAGTLTGTFALAVSSDGVDSGLFDVATGEHVMLHLNNLGEVEGRTQNTNLLVFTVSVDNAGMVTLDQLRALTHPDQNDPDDSVTLSAANLVQLTFTGTIVDRDGDSAISAATLNIGTALIFHDDGPSIQVGQLGEPDQLIVDETNLALNATQDFSDNFNITNSDFGADGAGTLSSAFALAIFSNNVDSGLIDVATGQHVLLTLTNTGVVEGRTAISNELVFTVSVDNAGMVTLDQIRALVHPDQNDPDDSVTLSAANLIQLTFTGTIVDRDGDTATSSTTLNIGQSLTFKDDGPSFTNINDPNQDDSIDIVAQNPATTTTNIVQLVDWQFGADSFGSNPFLQSVTGDVQLVSSTPTQVTLNFLDADSNVVATMILNANGTDSIEFFHREPTILQIPLGTGDADPGGPEPLKFIDIPTANLHVEVTADNGLDVNPSQQGWAVKNNLINPGEGIIFSFKDLSNTANFLPVQEFQFLADGFTGGNTTNILHLVVTLDDNSTQEFNVTVHESELVDIKSSNGQLIISVGQVVVDTVMTTHLIDSVDVENFATIDNIPGGTPTGNNDFRLNGVSVFAESVTPPPDLDYEFTLVITDGDGDTTTQAFTLQLQGADATSSPGYTVDGPIAGALIFQDLNHNLVLDAGEASTLSSPTGSYDIMLADSNLDGTLNQLDGRLVSIGGTDIQTGLSYDIPLFAPIGSQVITPITSILEMQLETKQESPQMVMENLVKALGLPSGSDLTKLNPAITTEGSFALAIAAAIMTLSTQLSAATEQLLGLPQSESIDEIYTAIGNQLMKLPEGSQADLSDPNLIQSIVTDLSNQLHIDASSYQPIMAIMIASQEAIHSVISSLPEGTDPTTAISEIQQITQGTYAHAITSYYHGDITLEVLNNLQNLLPQHETDASITATTNTENPETIVGNILNETSQETNTTQPQTESIISFKYYNEANQLVEVASGQSVKTYSGGTLTINTDGSFSYIPKDVHTPFDDKIEYKTMDQHGKQETGTMEIHTLNMADNNPENDNYIVDINDIQHHETISMNELGIERTALTKLPHADESQSDTMNGALSSTQSTSPSSSPSATVPAEVTAAPPPIEVHQIEQQQHSQD